VLNEEEFPELPNMSKAAKKKLRQQVGAMREPVWLLAAPRSALSCRDHALQF